MLEINSFKKGVGLLVETFPNHSFNLEFMFQMLKDLEPQKFINAVFLICNEQKELYPNTNIIALIREQAFPQAELLAGEAFGIMMSKVMQKSPDFGDPLIQKTVSAMGWKEIGASDVSQTATLRAQFIKIYNSFAERKKTEEINKNIPSLIQSLVKQIR